MKKSKVTKVQFDNFNELFNFLHDGGAVYYNGIAVEASGFDTNFSAYIPRGGGWDEYDNDFYLPLCEGINISSEGKNKKVWESRFEDDYPDELKDDKCYDKDGFRIFKFYITDFVGYER